MKIQILKDNFFIEGQKFNNFYGQISKLTNCKLVDEIKYESDSYFIIQDHHDLSNFDDKILSKTILLNIPSPSINERLSKYKVAGVVESRIYFNNFPFIFALKNTIDFNVFEGGEINYALDFGYISIMKKNRTDDYTLANMIVDYLKMHQDYFNDSLLK